MANGIRCPFCGSEDNQVVCTRDIDNGIRRRRHCSACRMRWNTFEYSEGCDKEIGQQMIRITRATVDAQYAIREAIEKLQSIRI